MRRAIAEIGWAVLAVVITPALLLLTWIEPDESGDYEGTL